MLITTLVTLPFLCAIVLALFPWNRIIGWIGVASAASIVLIGIAVSVRAVHGVNSTGLNQFLRADALSSFMVIVIGTIALLSTCLNIRYLELEIASGKTSKKNASAYQSLIQAFLGCMLVAVLSANIGVMWIAIEATTIITSLLIGHSRTQKSLEASWKYVVICSVGIALAFLGTALVYLAGLHAGIQKGDPMDWTTLVLEAHRLNAGIMRLAFALLLLGYGTKVGLVPLHSWLPDAHSQAPAPVSALMSGVLLTVAFYSILRFKVVTDAALGATFARNLLVVMGLLSLIIAASLLIGQHDYKRMLAYHSIEHMGLIALGAAAGTPLAIAAVLLHILGHGLAKSVLFLASGEVLATEGTSEINLVPHLLNRRPVLGGVFGFGLLALLGLPPFSLFISEFSMLRAEFQVGLGWAAAVSMLCMAIIFASVMSHGRHLLLGKNKNLITTGKSNESKVHLPTKTLVSVPLISGLIGCTFIGISAWPLQELLSAAAKVISS